MSERIKNKYYVPAAITAIISMVIYLLAASWSMKIINVVVESTQLLCATVSLVMAITCIYKRKDEMMYKIIAQALVCFILGEVYWVLHMFVKGYEQLGSFSISDLSWIGFYIFLLSIDYSLLSTAFKSERRNIKYVLRSIIAPVIIIDASILLYITGDSLFYTIIYCIPTVLLAYFSMKYLISPTVGKGCATPLRLYNLIILLILLFDNLVCLATSYDIGDAVYILKLCFAMLLLLIVPAAYKGVNAECCT